MESRRLGRLGSQIQEEVSEIIARKIKDPRLGFVTLTGVRVSADLSYASVYVSVLGTAGDIKRNLACLDSAKSFIRSELGKRLSVKHVPELRFHHDDSGARGARIDSILKDLKEAKDDGSPEGHA
ncbi:MAG: 30S ribosome-binding factor RbfA [bacterium]